MAEATANKKEAKKGGEEKDPSMEEILHSIRDIIAEDGDEKKPVTADKAPDKPANGAAEKVPGSDVLELTDMVKDDGSVVNVKETPAAAAPAAAPAAVAAAPKAPADVLNKIDEALAGDGKPAAPAAKPAAPAAPAAAPAAPSGDALLSDEAATAATTSIKKLKVEEPLPPLVTTPSPAFGTGTTVEDMVMQMLRPLVKSWLDTNLPAIVERIVEREVRKITRQ